MYSVYRREQCVTSVSVDQSMGSWHPMWVNSINSDDGVEDGAAASTLIS